MFLKYGSLSEASLTTVADWRKLIVEASVHQDPEKIQTLAEFEIDKDNFLYVRARAVSAGEHYGANDNGDYFPEDELVKYHKTFVRRGVYVNHKSDDPATAIGIILDAVWHGDKRKYVECLLAIDRAEPIARKIQSGIAHSWSMGALVKECECSVCAKRATSEAEYCDCLRNAMGKTWNGKKVYAVNHGLNFYELSNVTVPADPQAYTLSVLAAAKEENLKKGFLALADSYQLRVAQSAEKAAQDAVVGEVRRRIGAKADQTDRQVLGTVRHRLKVATAPILPREEDKMRQRVRSALEAGSARAERQNESIAETIPTEAINVQNNLTIRYLPGESLKECYFIGRRGNLQVVVTAAELLDEKAQRRIEGAEKAELIKDDSKPKADNSGMADQVEDNDGAPHKEVNPLSAKPAKELKDDSKASEDNKAINGKEPSQPSDVVKRYAQLLGAKSVTFKKGENGSFTAFLSEGSVSRLASLWNTSPRLMRTAKLDNNPNISREEARGEGRDPRNLKEMTWAKEDKRKEAAKPAGSSGSEMKSYFQGYNSKNLSEGAGDQWARKVNEMSRAAEAKDKEVKALKAENDILRKTVEAQKQAAVEEKKAIVVAKLMDYMEKAGAMRADAHEVLDLKEQGLSHEEAEVKAFANAHDRKRAELKELDVKALETMLSNLSDLAPAIRATAHKKDLELPHSGRDEQAAGDEDALARGW